MNRKLLGMIVAVLAVAVGLFVLNDKPTTPSSEGNDPTKSDFAKSDSLPGFESRREKSEREIDPSELEPLNPLIAIEPVVLREGERFEDLSEEDKARVEAQQREIATLISRGNQEKFDVQLADLVKGLGLDAAQENELRSYFEGIQAQIAGGDLQAYGTLERVLNGNGLEQVLQGVLSPEQLELHQSTADRLRQERAEKTAAIEFNQISSLLSLDQSQQKEVRAILTQNALQQEGGGRSIAPPDIAEQVRAGELLMQEIEAAGPDANALAIMMRNRLTQARDEQLKPFEGVLSEEQLELYRQSLEARDADLSGFQNSLNAFSANEGGAQ